MLEQENILGMRICLKSFHSCSRVGSLFSFMFRWKGGFHSAWLQHGPFCTSVCAICVDGLPMTIANPFERLLRIS